MSRRDKLVEKILKRPPEMSYAEVRLLLELFGWEHRSTEGSHSVFKKPGYKPITVSTKSGRKVPRYQLDQICMMLGLDE